MKKMKLHNTMIEKLIQIYTTYGGWQGEKKLKAELEKLNLAVYNQQGTGNQVLVDADALEKYISEINGK